MSYGFFVPLVVMNLDSRSSVLLCKICDSVHLVNKILLKSSVKTQSYKLVKHKVPCSGKWQCQKQFSFLVIFHCSGTEHRLMENERVFFPSHNSNSTRQISTKTNTEAWSLSCFIYWQKLYGVLNSPDDVCAVIVAAS